MGARARVRDLGDRAGVGAARAHRAARWAARARGRSLWATGLGAASSSCSYAAIAIAKSLFQKGASPPSALAFQFASTNLVWELGLVLWVLIGWQFTLAEYVGGIVMIVADGGAAAPVRLARGSRRRPAPRAATRTPATSTTRPASSCRWRERLTLGAGVVGRGAQLPRRLADAVEGDHAGFLLAGFVALLGNGFFEHALPARRAGAAAAIENVIVGPLIAVLSFVCSVGNVPLAAVLWSGGISFAGVMAFIFADLIVLPIIAIYRKYYGSAVHDADHGADVRDDGDRRADRRRLFSALGLVPDGPARPGPTSSAPSSSTTSSR